MIDFVCPRCAEPLSVPESQAGEPDTCPDCGHKLTVPLPDSFDSSVEEHAPVVPVTMTRPRAEPGQKKTGAENTLETMASLCVIFAVLSVIGGILFSLDARGPVWIIMGVASAIGLVMTAALLNAAAQALGYLRIIAAKP